ncbi:MAG TPA: hypothetical protein VKD70_01835 [Candidatus Acidoferrum sp.]|nr:hypothetical protein [Candidatus Acidoferrum sp.]
MDLPDAAVCWARNGRVLKAKQGVRPKLLLLILSLSIVLGILLGAIAAGRIRIPIPFFRW